MHPQVRETRLSHLVRATLAAVLAIAAGALGATDAQSTQPATNAEAGASDADRGGGAETAPNIVLVVTDDQDFDSYGRRTMPRVKEFLAERGSTFRNAVVTTPECCPSRATMITGQYPHNHGVLSNSPGYRRLIDRANLLPVWLQRAGYRTAHLGKYLNGYQAVEGRSGVPHGWDEWHTQLFPRGYYDYELSVNGRVEHYGSRARDHFTRVMNRKAGRLVRRFASDEDPFYLQLDHYAPHTGPGDEGRCRSAPVPDPRDRNRFRGKPLPQPPSFDERKVGDKPSFVRRATRLGASDIDKLTRRHGCRLASLRSVDRGLGPIYRALQDAGDAGETVILFTSDNGFFEGEHRIKAEKQLPYEEAIRVPLVIRVPRGYLGQRPVDKIGEPVANIDLVPTILELAGAQPCTEVGCRTIDGRSLLPLIRGQQDNWPKRRTLALEYGPGREHQPENRPCEYRGVRTSGMVYVEFTSAPQPRGTCVPVSERELYDLGRDPFQLKNLARSRAHDEARRRMAAKLLRLRDCAGIEGRGDPEPPSGHWCQ